MTNPRVISFSQLEQRIEASSFIYHLLSPKVMLSSRLARARR
jgi:hypothetical protein